MAIAIAAAVWRARRAIVVAVALASSSGIAWSQSYPNRPIRLVIGGSAGGGWDVTARLIAERMQEALAQPVVVDNKPGADGVVSADLVAKAAPDGYTLLAAVTSQMTMTPVLNDHLPYDPARDFQPVSMISRSPLVLVVGSSAPMRSVAELIGEARAHPGVLNYGANTGGFVFATELFKQAARVDIQRIPYKGTAQALTALLAGDIQMAIMDVPSALPLISAGRIRALAVTTPRRVPFLADVPTLAEAGVPGADVMLWIAMFAPAGTPAEIVARLQPVIARALEHPELREKLLALGTLPESSTPEALGETVRAETALYRGLARRAQLTAQQ
ncbi:MAG: tripartite tricarboxylate transporter substrate binding protein [Betaproteobacteria bacterium]